jgi:hypothetical protein
MQTEAFLRFYTAYSDDKKYSDEKEGGATRGQLTSKFNVNNWHGIFVSALSLVGLDNSPATANIRRHEE